MKWLWYITYGLFAVILVGVVIVIFGRLAFAFIDDIGEVLHTTNLSNTVGYLITHVLRFGMLIFIFAFSRYISATYIVQTKRRWLTTLWCLVCSVPILWLVAAMSTSRIHSEQAAQIQLNRFVLAWILCAVGILSAGYNPKKHSENKNFSDLGGGDA